jgi:hypothetical protein
MWMGSLSAIVPPAETFCMSAAPTPPPAPAPAAGSVASLFPIAASMPSTFGSANGL